MKFFSTCYYNIWAKSEIWKELQNNQTRARAQVFVIVLFLSTVQVKSQSTDIYGVYFYLCLHAKVDEDIFIVVFQMAFVSQFNILI